MIEYLPGRQLAAEAAAHVVADDADVRERQSECVLRLSLDAVDALERLPDGQLVRRPSERRTVRLDRRVDEELDRVGLLEDDVGLGEAGFDVATFVDLGCCRGAVGLEADCRWRAGRERRIRIGDEGQDLVVDLDRRSASRA